MRDPDHWVGVLPIDYFNFMTHNEGMQCIEVYSGVYTNVYAFNPLEIGFFHNVLQYTSRTGFFDILV